MWSFHKPRVESDVSKKIEKLSFSELTKATENFSEANKIGSGGFGVVYRGLLRDGRQVAVKKHPESYRAVNSFRTEIKCLSGLAHKNIVRLVGFCDEKRGILLVYEYMEKGDLSQHLHVEPMGSFMGSWKNRIKIALDAARGIEYLHNYAEPTIIHRNIKSRSILLDEKGNARITGFEIALMLPGDHSDMDHISAEVAGTLGYIDPESVMRGFFSTKSDLFSFGVVMLELLTGKRAYYLCTGDEQDCLSPEIEAGELSKVWDSRIGELSKVWDSRIGTAKLNELKALELVADTAMLCVKWNSKDRPTISHVVANLVMALHLYDNTHNNISSVSEEATYTPRLTSDQNIKLRLEEFSFSELDRATRNFSLEHIIRTWRFGTVYKGKLLDGRKVAVQRSESGKSTMGIQFDGSELTFLSTLQHKNLVRVFGFCKENDERLLVCEYMENGALYDHLHNSNNVGKMNSFLNSWEVRMTIALDAARGIAYLHNYAVPSIIHGAITSSNILLDENWTARISDFEFSLVCPESEINSYVSGSVGYVDPEYYELNKRTLKSDVYGFGIVLHELLTGKRQPILKDDKNGGRMSMSLVDFLDSRVDRPRSIEIELVEDVADLAFDCVSLKGRNRPTFSEIVHRLEKALGSFEDGISSGIISISEENQLVDMDHMDPDKGYPELPSVQKTETQKFPAKTKGCMQYVDHLIEVVFESLSFPRKNKRRIIERVELLKLRADSLFDMKNALEETIAKELMLGKKPTNETRTWLTTVAELEPRVHNMLKFEWKDSQFDASMHERLNDFLHEIVICLKKYPLGQDAFYKSPRRETKIKIAPRRRRLQGKEGVETSILPSADSSFRLFGARKQSEPVIAQKKTMQRQKREASLSVDFGIESVTVPPPLSPTSSIKSVASPILLPGTEIPYPHDTKESEIDLISFEPEEMSLEAEIPPVTQSDCDSVTRTREEEFSRHSAERHLKISMESTFPSGISISYPISPISISLPEPRPNNVKRSIQENVQNILGYITGKMTNVIAICGDVGIGKSTVLKAIASHSEVKTTFDFIILVTISRYWSTRKIQNEILQQLGHSPPADLETESEIAEKLFHSLKERRFLLLLDDLWDYIDLNLVGIPDLNMGVGFRVIIASTLPNICNLMATEVVMNMEGLYKEEALELFHEQLGEIIDSRDIQDCAKLIVERCCGLPLIIIVTGRALRNESDVELWRNARDYFLSIRREEFHGIQYVLQQLRFSYDRLKNQEVKNFLLYCVVFPEDHEISVSELIEYCIKEGLIDGDLKDAHKKGHNIVEILVNAALLEKTEDGVFIKMHDVIRDFALWVLSSDADHCCQFLRRSEFGAVQSQNISLYERSERNKYLLRANAGLTEAPTEKEWENAKLIFLMDNKLSNLPKSPICRDLLTLCLQRNKLLRVIPTSFFEHMSSLQVFNISETRIKSLPQSISMLKSLQTLILRNCENLVKLPTAIRFLVKLEILDLKGTEIYELPKEIGELTRLKHMEVSFFGYENVKLFPLVLVPHGIISNLHALKKLCIFVSLGDKRWSKNVEKSIILEVSTLTMLTSLSFYFSKVEHLSLFLETSPSWKSTTGLSEFKFIIGDNVKRLVARVPEDVNFDYDLHRGKSLRFVNGDGTIPEVVISVLKRATAFYLDHHLNIATLSEFGLPNMNGLKFCIIRECCKMSTIIVNDSATYHGAPLFTSLERLSIHYLLNLRNIYEGGVRMPIGSFSNLRVLSVQTCPKLSFLFSYSMIQCFSNLEELIVEDCLAMEHILIQNNVATSSFDSILPRLKRLTLRYLPKLVNIWNGSSWPPVVEQMSFYNCPELKNIGIGNGTDNLKLKESLREIKAERDWWDALEWETTATFLHLKPRFTEITDDDLL